MKALYLIALYVILLTGILSNANAQCLSPVTSTTEVYSKQARLNWEPVDDAIQYMLIASIQGIATIDTFFYSSSDSFALFTTLKTNNTYQWAVRSICDSLGTQSALSQILTFTTLPADSCAPPVILEADDISNSSAKVNWNNVPGVSSFLVTLQGAFPVLSDTNSYMFSGLEEASSYNWNVQSLCGPDTAQDTSVSSIQADFFTLECTLPDSIVADNIGLDSFMLSWTSTPAISYQLIFGLQGQKPDTLMINDSSTVFSSLSPETEYFVVLRSNCMENGLNFTSASSDSIFVTTQSVVFNCPDPGPISTTNVTLESARLNWNQVPNAVNYRVSGKELGSATYLDLTFNNSLSTFEAINLTQGVTYIWKIQAICVEDTSLYTEHDTFTTLLCPTPTNLIDTFISTKSAWLAWNKVDEAQNYRLFGKESSSPTVVQYVLPPDTVIFVNSLMSGSTYFWAVQSVCNLGTNFSSFLSGISNFTTLSPPEKQQTQNAFSNMGVYPNPASDILNVTVGRVSSINISSIDGKVLVSEELLYGKTYDVSSWPSGMYLIQLTSGSDVTTQKVIIR